MTSALVLIVDDFADARDMMSVYLLDGGFAVAEAANGEEAIAAAIREQPAIILMDMTMPVMDGWEATRLLKADPRTQAIPIIALTGHDLTETDRAALPCDSFIVRPCPPAQVVAEVARVLTRGRS